MPKIEIDVEHVIEDAAELGDHLIRNGIDDVEAASSIAQFLDDLLPMDVLIPGPAGVAVEIADGVVVKHIAQLLINAFRVSPEVREKRQARRAERKAARIARREKRRARKEEHNE